MYTFGELEIFIVVIDNSCIIWFIFFMGTYYINLKWLITKMQNIFYGLLKPN